MLTPTDLTHRLCARFPTLCSPNLSTLVNNLQHFDLDPRARIFLTEIAYILLTASILPVLHLAHRQRRTLQHQAHALTLAALARATALRHLWLTDDWMVLFGLCDLFLLGSLPSGPWKPSHASNLRAYPQKRYLRRLMHMGLVPLNINPGGSGVRRVKGFRVSGTWPWIRLPEYIDSERRAYFEFLVPMGRGYSREDGEDEALNAHSQRTQPFRDLVNALLGNKSEYLVTVSNSEYDYPLHFSHPKQRHPPPVEVGSEASVRAMLVWKRDRILQRSKGRHQQLLGDFMRRGVSPLLDTVKCPLVRVEAPEFGERRLEEWVYRMARDRGLNKLWNEGELHTYTSAWIQDNKVELEDRLISPEDRLADDRS